mmetsp:Transcript_424/g.836  ORF Transcript_424/g.836 Transcript_424/m.836 type:complete len:209 (+) Transcript_424:2529-3155(+)
MWTKFNKREMALMNGKLDLDQVERVGIFKWFAQLIAIMCALGSLFCPYVDTDLKHSQISPPKCNMHLGRTQIESKLRRHPVGSFMIRLSMNADHCVPVLCFGVKIDRNNFQHQIADVDVNGYVFDAQPSPLRKGACYETILKFLHMHDDKKFLVDAKGESTKVEDLKVSLLRWDSVAGEPRWEQFSCDRQGVSRANNDRYRAQAAENQ